MKVATISSESNASSFTVTSGALRVTDPGYQMDMECAGTLSNVLNGTWSAHIGYHDDVPFWGRRPAYLHIVAQGYERHFDHSTELDSTWQLADIDVYVDSGQAGFFDVAKYAAAKDCVTKDSAGKYGGPVEAFYDAVCNLTSGEESFGVVEFGCVSSSGYGDGGYDCYFRRNDAGQIVEAIIVYIEEFEEDQDD